MAAAEAIDVETHVSYTYVEAGISERERNRMERREEKGQQEAYYMDNRESFYVSIREAAINFWEATGMLTENTIFLYIQSLHLSQGSWETRRHSVTQVYPLSLSRTCAFLRVFPSEPASRGTLSSSFALPNLGNQILIRGAINRYVTHAAN